MADAEEPMNMREEDEDEDSASEEEEEEEESGEEDSDSEFDDPEGYVDDIPDEELLGDVLAKKPVLETGVKNVIVVDNAPKVGPDRMQKLKNVLNKVFSRFGEIVTQYFPVDENNIFKGYFFLEFATNAQAANAVQTGNGYKLDKSHIFVVNFFTDFEKYSDLPADWKPPVAKEFDEKSHENLRSWLLDENCYDQSAIIFNGGMTGAVCQHTPLEPRVVVERPHWTEMYIRWSPQGTYLATFHKQGVLLWGGAKFPRLCRFGHEGVQLIDFSPCERYLTTFSSASEDSQNIIVWDVKTGAQKRTFAKNKDDEEWPILKWSYDGKYFARMSDNLLSVYEVPSFGLLDKTSIVVKGIRDFAWSPTDYKIVYWVPETQQIPAKIIITEIPSRQEISTKSRHLVSDCKLHWQKNGEYLCVRVDHYMTKTRKQLCYSFEIFHIHEALVPVDTIEIKEPVVAFALEPIGSKFAVIHGEPPTRISASFYKINEKGAKVSKIHTITRQPNYNFNANNIIWSPKGQFVVLANLKGSDAGQLEFWNTGDMTMMNTAEHTMATDLEWDPTGRYVVTSISFWQQKMDTGFCMWSFQGKPLYRNPMAMDKFCSFLWRPRPLSLLTEDDHKNIRKDQKKYHHMFEQKDRTIKSRVSKELIEKRQDLMQRYRQYRKKKEEDLRKKQQKMADAAPSAPEEVEYDEEVFDILVKEEQETIE